jgi:hypothetical protein
VLPAPPPVGAPPANTSFFCDAGSEQCYLYVDRPASQPNATAYCVSQGGNLVTHRTAAKQMLLEVGTQPLHDSGVAV